MFVVRRKNSDKKFQLASLDRLLVYTKFCLGLWPWIKHLIITHNSFPYQKSQWKVQVNVVTPQELKMV